jgi:iron(III) transport system substrate-binding protein
MRPSRIIQSLLLVGLALIAAAASAQKTQLLVYTALETDQIKAYQEGFNKVYRASHCWTSRACSSPMRR